MEVARYKIYERLLTVGELPLTKVGKVGKKALREIARDALMRPDAVTANQLASRESRQSIPGRKSARDKSLAHWLEREIARLRAGEPAADGPDTSHIRQPTDTMWMSQPRSQVCMAVASTPYANGARHLGYAVGYKAASRPPPRPGRTRPRPALDTCVGDDQGHTKGVGFWFGDLLPAHEPEQRGDDFSVEYVRRDWMEMPAWPWRALCEAVTPGPVRERSQYPERARVLRPSPLPACGQGRPGYPSALAAAV
jgi:hypothetical protein